jgi:hypothetical protein
MRQYFVVVKQKIVLELNVSVRPSIHKVFQQEILLTSFDEIRLNKQTQATIRINKQTQATIRLNKQTQATIHSSLHHHPKRRCNKSREILIKRLYL